MFYLRIWISTNKISFVANVYYNANIFFCVKVTFMRLLYSSVKWKTLSTSYSKLEWSMRTHIYNCTCRSKARNYGRKFKVGWFAYRKKPNIQGFFSLTKSQLMDLKSYYLVHLPFKTILLQSVQFVFMKFLPMQK